MMSEVSALLRDLRSVADDYAELATLEVKRSGISLAIMVGAGVGIALMLVTAWMGLMAAGVLGLVAAGLAPAWAILCAVLLNLVIAAGLFFLIRRKQKDLGLPATLRSLRAATSRSDSGVH